MAAGDLTTISVGPQKITVRTGYADTGKDIAIFPSEGEYPVYEDATYDTMNDDLWCDAAYVEAIQRLVPGRTVLDIGTGRDANWAIEAARAGARKVYAVEVLEEWAETARHTVAEAGLSETITVVTGCSTDIQLPEQIDVCVSEIIGTIGGSEGAAAAIQDARSRFMNNSGQSVPHRCTTGIAGISLSDEFPAGIVLDPHGMETMQKIFTAVGHAFDVRLSLDGPLADKLLTDSSEVESLEFNGILSTAGSDQVRLTVTRSGRLTGLTLWPLLQARLDGLLLNPLYQDTSWLPCYVPLFLDGVAVQEGDVLDLSFDWELSDDQRHPDYRVSGTVQRQSGNNAPFSWHSAHHAPRFKTSDSYRWLFPDT